MKSFLIIIVLIVVDIHSNDCFNLSTDRVIRLCILNCGQCKSMYGDFFMGQQCADHCFTGHQRMERGEEPIPDCNSPVSILPFIRKLVDESVDNEVKGPHHVI